MPLLFAFYALLRVLWENPRGIPNSGCSRVQGSLEETSEREEV